ncbi:MAG: hypothetical protein J0L93_01670 [Deltaproteobacteria bacterium]|nr:hypothetical protein [Deltaproteobacteria bacterium]
MRQHIIFNSKLFISQLIICALGLLLNIHHLAAQTLETDEFVKSIADTDGFFEHFTSNDHPWEKSLMKGLKTMGFIHQPAFQAEQRFAIWKYTKGDSTKVQQIIESAIQLEKWDVAVAAFDSIVLSSSHLSLWDPHMILREANKISNPNDEDAPSHKVAPTEDLEKHLSLRNRLLVFGKIIQKLIQENLYDQAGFPIYDLSKRMALSTLDDPRKLATAILKEKRAKKLSIQEFTDIMWLSLETTSLEPSVSHFRDDEHDQKLQSQVDDIIRMTDWENNSSKINAALKDLQELRIYILARLVHLDEKFVPLFADNFKQIARTRNNWDSILSLLEHINSDLRKEFVRIATHYDHIRDVSEDFSKRGVLPEELKKYPLLVKLAHEFSKKEVSQSQSKPSQLLLEIGMHDQIDELILNSPKEYLAWIKAQALAKHPGLKSEISRIVRNQPYIVLQALQIPEVKFYFSSDVEQKILAQAESEILEDAQKRKSKFSTEARRPEFLKSNTQIVFNIFQKAVLLDPALMTVVLESNDAQQALGDKWAPLMEGAVAQSKNELDDETVSHLKALIKACKK